MMKPVPSPLPPSDSATTFTTAGRTRSTTSTTPPLLVDVATRSAAGAAATDVDASGSAVVVLTVHADSARQSARTGSISVRRDTSGLPFLVVSRCRLALVQANRSRCESRGSGAFRPYSPPGRGEVRGRRNFDGSGRNGAAERTWPLGRWAARSLDVERRG